jgi:hypothetical protein
LGAGRQPRRFGQSRSIGTRFSTCSAFEGPLEIRSACQCDAIARRTSIYSLVKIAGMIAADAGSYGAPCPLHSPQRALQSRGRWLRIDPVAAPRGTASELIRAVHRTRATGAVREVRLLFVLGGVS